MFFYESAPEIGKVIYNAKGVAYQVTDHVVFADTDSRKGTAFIMAIKADGSSSRKARFYANQIQS
jgi:hypothetical protein